MFLVKIKYSSSCILFLYNKYDSGPLLSVNLIFAKLQTLKIIDVYKYQVSKFVFKCINKIAPINFQNWFSINHERHGHHTRLNFNITDGNKINNLFIPSARTTNYGLNNYFKAFLH